MDRKKVLFLIGVFLIFGIFFSELASAQFSGSSSGNFGRSNRGTASFVSHGANLNRYYGSSGRLSTYYPQLKDSLSCQAREDIIIQVTPAGCQPAVVRSDLLAEQNVPVFCQLDALQLNPAVDIKQIRNIRFKGNYPPEVSGVGFHPARAALRTRDKLLGSPLESNIGYVVIVLKRNPNENEQLDFLNFTLQASIDYYTSNSLGVGKTEFLLEKVEEKDWASERDKQSFFKGDYSVRLEDSDPQFIRLVLYKGDVQFSTVDVERAKSNREVYLPGNYCQTALQFNYDGLISPDKIAKLQVGDDFIDVYEKSRFLNNKCSVRKISGDESGGEIEINCGREKIKLSTKARVLDIETEVKIVNETGDELDGIWKVTKINGNNNTYVLKKVGSSENKEVRFDLIKSLDKKYLIEKQYGEADKYFEDAIKEYDSVVDNYASEKQKGTSDLKKTFGQRSLEKAILLSLKFEKQVTAKRLIEDYLEIYPGGEMAQEFNENLREFDVVDSSSAGAFIYLDDGLKLIKLKKIRNPRKQTSAKISWRSEVKTIIEKQTNNFSLGSIGLLEVKDIGEVKVKIDCKDSDRNKKDSGTLTLKTGGKTISKCGGILRLENVELNKYVKLRITPVTKTGGFTNISVGIGVEKRAFELTPEKARKRIKNLNETIAKWSSISENLGNVVKGLKGACFATAGILTVKNFFTGLSGEALARQQVMRGENGWTEKCKGLLTSNGGPYSTLTECYNDKSEDINKDVGARAKAIKLTNVYTKSLEEKYKTSEGGFFGGDTFDQEKAKADLLEKINIDFGDVSVEGISGKENVGKLLGDANSKDLTYSQLRDLYHNALVKKSSPEVGGSSSVGVGKSEAELNRLGLVINERIEYAKRSKALSGIQVYNLDGRNQAQYFGDTVKDLKGKIDFGSSGLAENAKVQIVQGRSANYLVVLDDSLREKEIRQLNDGVVGNVVDRGTTQQTQNIDLKGLRTSYKLITIGSYENGFVSGEAEVRYFEMEPYKGMPAIVPFDLNRGFYVATKQTLPLLGGAKSFESSGRPSSFWVCNVMGNKKIDFDSPGFGDDQCVQFNMYTGQSFSEFPLMSKQQTQQIVGQAVKALEEAARQHGQTNVRIGTNNLNVGNAAAIIPGTQCQDFMSPGDCKLLFNVCDPVICPASRCNFGGAYQVSDVIQSGIVGSALLCLPNAKEGIIAPVCLTGIKAGIDGYLSILESHRACLQENIESGQYVGICDQLTAVYTCEFFWKQAAPLANVLLPKIVEFATTGSIGKTRGGGEYLTVQSSYKNAQDSVQFFTQNYAVNSMEAFRARNIEEAGSQFCKAFLSSKGPNSFSSLIEPDSPPQFHSWFSQVPFTDATVPATSQYKVFYHIFAGKDRGVSYNVYLKDPPENVQFRNAPFITVANGFAPRGEFATETKDFTAPKGYRTLCVRINDKEECGFKQVSSSFAVNYVKDSFVSDELTRTDISSEKECISGSINPSALLNPNLQSSVEEAINPEIYNRGVTRICATANPGLGTNPSRFVDVGNCGEERVRCWLDEKSVETALNGNNKFAKTSTLSELEKRQKDMLVNSTDIDDDLKVDVTIRGFESRVASIGKAKIQKLLEDIDKYSLRVFWNYHQAELIYLKGLANDIVFGKSVDTTKVTSDGKKKEEEKEEGDGTLSEALVLKLEKGYRLNSTDKNNLKFNGKEIKIYVKGLDIKIDNLWGDDLLAIIDADSKEIIRWFDFRDDVNEMLFDGAFEILKEKAKNINDLENGIFLTG